MTGVIALLNCTLDDFTVFISGVDVAWSIPYISNSIFQERFEFEAFFDEGIVRLRRDLCGVRFPPYDDLWLLNKGLYRKDISVTNNDWIKSYTIPSKISPSSHFHGPKHLANLWY